MVLTADLDRADDALVGLVRRLATTVALPALAHSREHLPGAGPRGWMRRRAALLPGGLGTPARLALARQPRRAADHGRRAGAPGRGRHRRDDDLPDELRGSGRARGLLESAERDAVAEALRAAGGNRTRAAAALGIGRNTLYRKMREFGLG